MVSGNLDTQLSGIPAAVRTNLATELGRLDAAISSRLAASGYTAPPSAADNANAVWSAGSRTVTGGTVDTLTNAPTVPSAAQIATQVRTELSTELGRIDAAVSTRLAPSGTLARVTLVDTVTDLANAPDVPMPAEIAEAVRDELAPELARAANTATTDEVADIVSEALDPP